MAAPCCVEARGEIIVSAAQSWLGTAYRHQASCRGVGTDCLGLVRGIWREVVGPEPEAPGAYSPDWAVVTREEAMLDGLKRHMIPVERMEAVPGDALVFRMLQRGPAKHVAILSAGRVTDQSGTMIHAYSGHAVCETRLSEPWLRRLVAAFRFPAAA